MTVNNPTFTHRRPDAVDRGASLKPDSPTFTLRELRPEFLSGAEECRRAVLEPEDDLELPRVLRLALAVRAARHGALPALIDDYKTEFATWAPDVAHQALADGVDAAELPPSMAVLARHADMIACRPANASKASLDALVAAGFSVPQIVAISGLLAFISFQVRIAAGLAAMEGDA